MPTATGRNMKPRVPMSIAMYHSPKKTKAPMKKAKRPGRPKGGGRWRGQWSPLPAPTKLPLLSKGRPRRGGVR
jgi:hypothetical protein